MPPREAAVPPEETPSAFRGSGPLFKTSSFGAVVRSDSHWKDREAAHGSPQKLGEEAWISRGAKRRMNACPALTGVTSSCSAGPGRAATTGRPRLLRNGSPLRACGPRVCATRLHGEAGGLRGPGLPEVRVGASTCRCRRPGRWARGPTGSRPETPGVGRADGKFRPPRLTAASASGRDVREPFTPSGRGWTARVQDRGSGRWRLQPSAPRRLSDVQAEPAKHVQAEMLEDDVFSVKQTQSIFSAGNTLALLCLPSLIAFLTSWLLA